MSSCACVHVCPTAVYEMSNILNTGLDKQSLAILVNLCEAGVNPEALAAGMLGDLIDVVVPLEVGTSADLNTLSHVHSGQGAQEGCDYSRANTINSGECVVVM